MSVLGAFLVLAAGPADVPTVAEAREIVVTAEKLKQWRGNWGSRNGVLSCRTTKSTGDVEIDAVGCQALVTCAAPHVPRFQAIAAAKASNSARRRQMDAAAQAMMPCLAEQRAAGIAALADRRAGA
jgi:hypothetical protein